jgi:DNA-binding transcriptional MerR regulator
MRVGELAARAGVGIDTVRFYERRGVLPRAARLRSGYRSFSPEALARLMFAKKLRSLGFGLDEVVGLLALVDQGEVRCEAAGDLVGGIVRRLDEQIASLVTMRGELTAMLEGCTGGECAPLVEARSLVRPQTATVRNPAKTSLRSGG